MDHYAVPLPASPGCFPVGHPEYRYSPSKNPYWSKLHDSLELRGRIYGDNDTESHRGTWRRLFPDSATHPEPRRELHVEVGCNAGHVTLEWAKANPKAAYIGLDWKFKPIFRAAQKGLLAGLGNMIFFRAHAERLPYMFGPGEIDFLHLFFPDPWPKKAHWKNRYITAERLRLFREVVRPGGIFHIKTDHPGYFEWIEEAIAQVGDAWQVTECTRDLHAGNPQAQKLKIPEVTLFEQLFIKDGIKIQSVKLRAV